VAAGEAGPLDQPGGWHLDLAVPGRFDLEAGYPDVRPAPGPGGRLDPGQGSGVEHRVEEERSGAARVRIGRVDHHALALPELDDRGPGLGPVHLAAGRD